MSAQIKIALVGVLVVAFAAFGAPGASASFGFEEGSFDAFVHDQAGSAYTQAGGHPASAATTFRLKRVVLTNEKHESETYAAEAGLRNVTAEIPPGLIGNPTAAPRCALSAFYEARAEILARPCPDSTQVGIVETEYQMYSFGPAIHRLSSPLYNLQPQPGQPALFGFYAAAVPVLAVPSVRSDSDYGLDFNVVNIDQSVHVLGNEFTFWGNPASPAHDTERGTRFFGKPNEAVCFDGRRLTQAEIEKAKEHNEVAILSCPSGAPEKAFLTYPTDCAHGPFQINMELVSWVGTSDFASVLTRDDEGNPVGASRCDRVPFKPSIEVRPTTRNAENPTGLDFEMQVPDSGLLNPEGIAQANLEKAIVTLPEGFTVNPSAGAGLGACSEADFAKEQLETNPGEGCPNSSKLGTVRIDSPLLETGETAEGSLYLAQPNDPTRAGQENPFDSLLAIYMVARVPQRGVIVRAEGKVELDPATGRIVTTFDNLPQLPFSSFVFHFREGARAPLVSPPFCGEKLTEAKLYPYSAPETPVIDTSVSQITAGVDGGACPSGGTPPLAPTVISGTQSNDAGSYSPFYLRIARQDGEQEITKFTTILPPGLTGNLTGIPFCPEAAIEAARQAGGRAEIENPSCPAASEIGHTLVGAGVGSVLAYTPGKLYLAGPYHGSALSLVSVTSAVVGPFDLGTVVIRFALRINPVTAQVEVDSNGSDPIPHILQGVVVHVRDIRVYVDRHDFILNATNCAPMSIANTITGAGADIASAADDQSVQIATRFQEADCAKLAFTPSFKVATTGKTSRRSGTSLDTKVGFPAGSIGRQSNLAKVKVVLPRQLPSRLTTLQRACTDKVFNVNPAACPPESRIGTATTSTPIVPVPLSGPVYFVSHGAAKFPELIIVLQGYGITVQLHGETFISSKGLTSTTFRTVPDVPFEKFELTLPQGPFSALTNNGNLCTASETVTSSRRVKRKVDGKVRYVTVKTRKTVKGLFMRTLLIAQNGATINQNTPIAVSGCPKAKASAVDGKQRR